MTASPSPWPRPRRILENAGWRNQLQQGVTQLGALSYSFILAREFAPGLDAADEAIALAPDMIWLYGNRAHALMFLDRPDEAQALTFSIAARKRPEPESPGRRSSLETSRELRKAGSHIR